MKAGVASSPIKKNGDSDASHRDTFHCVVWLLKASSKISGET